MISKYVMYLTEVVTLPVMADSTSYLKYSLWLCDYDSLLRLFGTLRWSIFMFFVFVLLYFSFEEIVVIIYQRQ